MVDVHPEARAEFDGASNWYWSPSNDTSERFVAEVREAFASIEDRPESWPRYLYGTRRRKLKSFPYLVVYRQMLGGIQVIAVAHGSRKPGYWRDRL